MDDGNNGGRQAVGAFQKLSEFMNGRNGPDRFSNFLFIVFAVVDFISNVSTFYWLKLLAYPILAYCLFRVLSKDIPRREAENIWFSEASARARDRWKAWRARRAENKEYKHFLCPNCGRKLKIKRRKVKGKGKVEVEVTCSICQAHFKIKL